MALGGISLIITSIILICIQNNIFQSQANSFYTQAAIWDAQRNLLMGEASTSKNYTDTFLNNMSTLYITGNQLIAVAKENVELGITTRTNNIFLIPIIIFGFFLTTVGFRLWYLRLQVYLDIIVEREANKDK
jgi:hypothetical protein